MAAVETFEFLRDAALLISDAERSELVTFVASNPEVGKVIPSTGGVRKLRWALQGRGKRGGARVLYYFYNATIPVFLLGMYAKNEKDNLTQAQKNSLKRWLPQIAANYGRRV